MIDEPLMSVRDAAALLGYESEAPVRRMIAEGQLEAFKIRGRIRISSDAIGRLLEATRVRPRPPAPPPADAGAGRVAARSDVLARRSATGEGGSSSFRERRRRRRTA